MSADGLGIDDPKCFKRSLKTCIKVFKIGMF